MNVSVENFTSPEVHPSVSLMAYEDLIMNDFRAGLLFFNLLFGVPANSYVVWLIARQKRLSSEYFNVNLTITDLFFSLSFFINVLKVFPRLTLLNVFFEGLTITGRPLFQCLICVERYLAVVHPVTFLKYKPLRYRVICSAIVWIITLGSSLVCIFVITLPSLHVYIWFFTIQFLLFLSIQLFCLVAVLRALKQSGPGERKKEREEENHMKRRAFFLILITTATLVVMFAPFIFTGFLCVLRLLEQKYVSGIWFFSLCCFILSGFVQPVLYLHRVRKPSCLFTK